MGTGRRVISAIAGVTLFLVAVSALVARYLPIGSHLVLYGAIASPYLMLAAPVALLILLWGRHWVFGALAGVLTVAVVAIHVPSYVRASPPPDSVRIRVMTANLLYGRADPQTVTNVAAANADVVMLEELNPGAVRGLTAAGMDRTFPYRALDARDEAKGVGIYSRYPITDETKIGGYELAMVSARIRVDGVARDVSLLSVHLSAPWPQPVGGWEREIATLPTTLAEQAAKAEDGAVIVGGDFNATIDMQPFRRLLTNGYRDAAQQAGDGRNLTYPADRKKIPPVIGIDHVLTRNATATSTSTVFIPDTDHRALLATVLVPRT